MSLVRRSNDLFPTFFNDFLGNDWSNIERTTSMPAVNIKENKNEFEVEVAAPGMSKKDFKIELDNNTLTISYERKEDKEEKSEEGQYTRREFNYQAFRRSFTLPNTVESDKINAKYDEGILRLTIPKKEEAKQKASRVIDIS
ncbi:Hsp20/alpha crystallin family protein [Fulvivirga imtechensis]|nr:Hsp20/alpha crystallin family protein [Fulvivirga imtechensis]